MNNSSYNFDFELNTHLLHVNPSILKLIKCHIKNMFKLFLYVCLKVPSECGKYHFRDPNFQNNSRGGGGGHAPGPP